MVFHANVKFQNFKLRIYDYFRKNQHTELKLVSFFSEPKDLCRKENIMSPTSISNFSLECHSTIIKTTQGVKTLHQEAYLVL